MLRLTTGRVGCLLARRATAAVTTSSTRMASKGEDRAKGIYRSTINILVLLLFNSISKMASLNFFLSHKNGKY